MSPTVKALARRQDYHLLAVSGFCLAIFAAVAFNLYGLGGDFVHLVIEKCLARCPGLVPAVQVGLYGLQASLIFALAFLSLRALARCSSESLRLTSLCRALRRVEPPSRLTQLLSECGLAPRQVSYFPGSLGVAFTVGFISPRIFLSSRLAEDLTDEELKAVLRHEHKHLRRRDPLRGLVFSLFANFFFFLPAARTFLEEYGKEAEFVADDHALSLSPSPAALASALVKVARGAPAPASQLAGSAGADLLVERLSRILPPHDGARGISRPTPFGFGRLAPGLLLALGLFLFSLPRGSFVISKMHSSCPQHESAACCLSGSEGRTHADCPL